MKPSTRLLGLPVAVFLISSFTLPLLAAEPTVVWDPARTSSPDSVAELKALETRVKKIEHAVEPTVVGILVGSGAGSGVIVSADGIVLTAAHVIGKPDRKVTIVLADGSLVEGKSLGVNADADSGMLRITGKPPASATWPGAKEGKWPYAPIGPSESLKKGQWLIALGHPGGPKRDRPPPLRVGRFEQYNKSDNALRTDCTLVGGDSGGPLFDLNGKVVGIHSRIGLFLEYNIHVPTEIFQAEWDQLLAGTVIGKKEEKAELGITLDEEAESAIIKEVAKGSPAADAGLKPGDAIVKFKGEIVHTADDLIELVGGCKPKERVTVEVQRGDKIVKIRVTLRKRE
ncbi:MAG: S1C family serine protease [Bacteroidales bacterium]|nr:S1C family serine protease [Bacteroidales bacterium]